MKSEISHYYNHHFGSFDPLTLEEIKEYCDYELSLVNLPELSCKKAGNSPYSVQPDGAYWKVKACLREVLKYSGN